MEAHCLHAPLLNPKCLHDGPIQIANCCPMAVLHAGLATSICSILVSTCLVIWQSAEIGITVQTGSRLMLACACGCRVAHTTTPYLVWRVP